MYLGIGSGVLLLGGIQKVDLRCLPCQSLNETGLCHMCQPTNTITKEFQLNDFTIGLTVGNIMTMHKPILVNTGQAIFAIASFDDGQLCHSFFNMPIFLEQGRVLVL